METRGREKEQKSVVGVKGIIKAFSQICEHLMVNCE